MSEIINLLIHKYNLTRSPDVLSDTLYALGNTQLWVPGNVYYGEDRQSILCEQAGDASDGSRKRFLPEYLQSGKESFFPLFVEKEDSPEDYRKRFSWIEFTLNQAASITLKTEQLSGIVVNAFTEPFVISKDFLEYLSNKMNSYVVPKGTRIAIVPIENDEESLRILSVIKDFANADNLFAIRKIYVALMVREEEISYLVIIDAASQEYETIFRKLNILLMKTGKLKYPLDFCPWSQTMEKEVAEFGIEATWDWMNPIV